MTTVKNRIGKCWFAVLLAALSAVPTTTVIADSVLFDNFSEPLINLDRWRTGYSNEGAVELITEIRGGNLHMRSRGIADNTISSGERGNVVNRLFMTDAHAAPLRMFQWYARVNLAETRGCADLAATESRARFRHLAHWFNNGLSTGSSDYTGNVYSILGFRKSSDPEEEAGRVEVLGNVAVCTNSGCSESQSLWFDKFGSVAVKENVLLRTAWDKDAKQFRFIMKPQGGPTVSRNYSYTGLANDDLEPVIKPDRFPRHQFRAQAQASECDVAGSGSQRPYGSIDVKVYNVRTDTTSDGY